MEIMKTLELCLNIVIREKTIKKFKEEYPVKSIDIIELLDAELGKEFALIHTQEQARREYKKIEGKIGEDVINKLIEKIKKIIE